MEEEYYLLCLKGKATTKLFQNLSFSLNEGAAIHILGSNGSGKTSLLKIISGLTKQTKGKIEKNYNKDICFIGHKNALKQYLTVEDNLSLSFNISINKSSNFCLSK